MRILALDTSAKAASCALWQDGTLLGENFLNNGLTHSQTILPMVDELLRRLHLGVAELDRLAVSAGPGSFTGLRIGLSAVKGMAMAAGKPCVPVSTLEALARNPAGFQGVIVPVMDARRSQVYAAVFRGEGSRVLRLEEDRAVSIDTLGDALEQLAPAPCILVGDGAALCYGILRERLGNLILCPETARHQRAASVAAAAAELEPVAPGELAPVYLRLPQAERELLERQNKEAKS